MISATHPLCGRLLDAWAFRRVEGVVLLVVELPDGSPGTIEAEATSVLGDAPAGSEAGEGTVLSAQGVRRLRRLVDGLAAEAGESDADRRRG